MDNIINVKELRTNMGKYEKRVAKGDSFVVMKRSKPIFRLSPINEDGWETVIDFAAYKKGGMPAEEVIKILEDMDA